MVPQTRFCQCQHSRRKKHSLVIGMRYQQTDALIAEFWETRTRHGDRVQPEDDDEYGQSEEGEPFHTCSTRINLEVDDVKQLLAYARQVICGGDEATLQFWGGYGDLCP